MSLHPETERRIREFFGAHKCCKCGGPAARLCQNQFYCAEHFRSARPKKGRRPRAQNPNA